MCTPLSVLLTVPNHQIMWVEHYKQHPAAGRIIPRLHGIKELRWHDLVRFGTVIVLLCKQSQRVARVRMLETAGERKAASENAGERTESSENAEERKARDRPHPRKRTPGPLACTAVACCRINVHAPIFELGIHMA